MSQNVQSKTLERLAEQFLDVRPEHFDLLTEINTLSKTINKSAVDIDGIYDWVIESKDRGISSELIALAHFCKFTKDENISILHEYTRKHSVDDQELLGRVIGEFLKQNNRKKNRSWIDLKKTLKTNLSAHFKDYMQKNTNLFIESPLENLVKLGISIVKCPACAKGKEKNCPTCDDNIKRIGNKVPLLGRSHSIIRCSITGELIDDANHGYCTTDSRIIGKRTLDNFNSNKESIKFRGSKKKIKKQETERIYFL